MLFNGKKKKEKKTHTKNQCVVNVGLFWWFSSKESVFKAGDTRDHHIAWAALVAQLVKNLPVMQETQVRSLGQEDPLEEDMENPMDRGAWQATAQGVAKSWTW